MSDLRPSNDDYFVGYLPMPRRERRFLLALLPLLIGLGLVAAVASAGKHADPGAARWDTEHIAIIEGVATIAPYAQVRSTDAAGAATHVTLLVSEGKHGAIDRIRPFEGKLVRVRGHLLQRDGRSLLELDSSPQGVERVDSTLAPPPSTVRSLGRVTRRGEIIDPKCYFGAMKPGDGKVHKECATLCILGGVPPMLLSADDRGRPDYFLLVAADGSAANNLVLPDIGEPVEVSGTLEMRDDLSVLRVEPGGIRPRR